MQKNIDLSKKIAIELEPEYAFQILLAMFDVMRSLDGEAMQENTLCFYANIMADITNALQNSLI
ncbi:MAG: hypothetical protein ACFNX1_01240 [Treponema lecithinolyticum]|uniref:hypothetical protein n=1 Tax=Treponema lecithinolyticum TaxID=53418 RepID=UPI0036173965